MKLRAEFLSRKHQGIRTRTNALSFSTRKFCEERWKTHKRYRVPRHESIHKTEKESFVVGNRDYARSGVCAPTIAGVIGRCPHANPHRGEDGIAVGGADISDSRLAQGDGCVGAFREADVQFGLIGDTQWCVGIQIGVPHLAAFVFRAFVQRYTKSPKRIAFDLRAYFLCADLVPVDGSGEGVDLNQSKRCI